MNLFATVLTYTAPSANYRGESAENGRLFKKSPKAVLNMQSFLQNQFAMLSVKPSAIWDYPVTGND